MLREAIMGLSVLVIVLGAACASGRPNDSAMRSISTDHRESPFLDLWRVELVNKLDLVGNSHSMSLSVQGRVVIESADPAMLVDSMLIIDRCIMDDGTDITAQQEAVAPTPSLRLKRIPGGAVWGYGRESGLAQDVQTTFNNIPPHPYRAIEFIRGHALVLSPQTLQTIRVAIAEDAAASEGGWVVRVQGIHNGRKGPNNGRVIIERAGGDQQTPGPYDPPKFLRIDALDAEGNLCGECRLDRSTTRPGGVSTDFGIAQTGAQSDGPAPAVLRIEFVADVEVVVLPFERTNIILTRGPADPAR